MVCLIVKYVCLIVKYLGRLTAGSKPAAKPSKSPRAKCRDRQHYIAAAKRVRNQLAEFSRVCSGRFPALAGDAATHPMSGRELRVLRQLKRTYPESPFLFVTERGGPMTEATVRKLVARFRYVQGSWVFP
jgi:hypothetical protein